MGCTPSGSLLWVIRNKFFRKIFLIFFFLSPFLFFRKIIPLMDRLFLRRTGGFSAFFLHVCVVTVKEQKSQKTKELSKWNFLISLKRCSAWYARPVRWERHVSCRDHEGRQPCVWANTTALYLGLSMDVRQPREDQMTAAARPHWQLAISPICSPLSLALQLFCTLKCLLGHSVTKKRTNSNDKKKHTDLIYMLNAQLDLAKLVGKAQLCL